MRSEDRTAKATDVDVAVVADDAFARCYASEFPTEPTIGERVVEVVDNTVVLEGDLGGEFAEALRDARGG